ncbi:hypothetical protein [Psychroserpens sp. NJDZ02]|uniref:hypothetical protein n=1 Tax=Psychroserpens sp. NJDZ02 TaxID=2570561 RepID=UPI0010A8D6D2|nr:hypothetical protein [Psychroserpens sp. NJDZ02]QCE43354.1 hypothetical protein E9099_18655 [Psychroserpens sp. NJDZ02]
MKKILASLCIAVGFTLTNCVSFKYVCETDERWPMFYGFPFVQSTDSWVFSMSGDLFIKGFIGNVVFWSLLIFGLINLLDTVRHKFFKVIIKVVIVVLCVLSVVLIYFESTIFDWNIHWDHDNFKMNYYQQDLDCEKTFKFFD